MRHYPNPTADRLREKLARLRRCQPDHLIAGNGCDELLVLAVRCFVEPVAADVNRRAIHSFTSVSTVQHFTPSYSLHLVLADIHGSAKSAVTLEPEFSLPSLRELKRAKQWYFRAALTITIDPTFSDRG